MIPRYSRPEIADIWTDGYKFQRWLEVEIAVTQAWSEIGVVPPEDAVRIAEDARINVDDIGRYIDETHHDVTAFLRSVADSLGDESRWVHYGLTSNDVWDTATSLQLVAASDVITGQIRALRDAIARRAVEHKRSVCAGRTHGVTPSDCSSRATPWPSGRCRAPSAPTPPCRPRSRSGPAVCSGCASPR